LKILREIFDSVGETAHMQTNDHLQVIKEIALVN